MLKQKIQQNLTQAVKNKEELKSSVLRMLLAVILNKEKEKRLTLLNSAEGTEEKPELKEEEIIEKSKLTDEEMIAILSSETKKRKEAILGYEKGNRKELVEKEKKELEILQEYLPKQLSEEEIKVLAEEVIKEVNASAPKDIGKVMAKLTLKTRGRADGATVSKIVKELLILDS